MGVRLRRIQCFVALIEHARVAQWAAAQGSRAFHDAVRGLATSCLRAVGWASPRFFVRAPAHVSMVCIGMILVLCVRCCAEERPGLDPAHVRGLQRRVRKGAAAPRTVLVVGAVHVGARVALVACLARAGSVLVAAAVQVGTRYTFIAVRGSGAAPGAVLVAAANAVAARGAGSDAVVICCLILSGWAIFANVAREVRSARARGWLWRSGATDAALPTIFKAIAWLFAPGWVAPVFLVSVSPFTSPVAFYPAKLMAGPVMVIPGVLLRSSNAAG